MIIRSGSETEAGLRGSPTNGDGASGRVGGGAGIGSGGAAVGRSLDETFLLDLDRPALEDQREYLLTSLRDLEAEHDAGDIGDHDYENLRDDYTARAAGVLRALEAEHTGRRTSGVSAGLSAGVSAGRTTQALSNVAPGGSDAAERARRRWRTAAIAAGIAVVAVLAAWAVTASSGSRLANQPITGTFAGGSAPGASASGGSAAPPALDPRLSQAAQLVQKGKITDALKLYDQILKDRPNDPDALASEGWLIAQAGMAANRTDLVDQGLTKIEAAERADASFATAHFFRGSLLLQAKGDAPGAVTELREYLGLVSPTAPEVPQVEQMLQAAIKAAGSNVPPGPNAPPTSKP